MTRPAAGDLLDSPAAGPAAVRGGVLRLGGYVAGTLVSVVATALLFRHLGVHDGGRYVTVIALVTLAAGLTDAGLTTIGVREFATVRGAEREALMRDLLGTRIALTLAGAAAAIAFAALAGYGETLVLGTCIGSLAMLAQALASAYGVGLMASLRLGWVTASDLIRQVAAALAVIALVLLDGNLLAFFTTNVVGNAAGLLAVVAVVRGVMPLWPAFHPRRWLPLLHDALPFAVATAVGAIYFRLAMILVSLTASAEQTGYYGASFRGVEVLLVVPQLLVGAAFPIFSRAASTDRARLAYAVGKVFDASLVVGLAIGLALGFGAPFVIDVVAGSDFAPAADVLRIHGVSLVASAVAAGWGYAALSLRLHRQLLVVNLAALVTSAILVPSLASVDGARGAAIATVAAEVVMASGLALSVRRAGVRLTPDRRALPRVLASAAASAAAGLAVHGAPSVVAASVALVVFASALLLLRALPEELLAAVRR